MTNQPEEEPDRPVRALATDRDTILLGGGALLLILAVPAALFLYRGQKDVAIGLIAIFAIMVLATGYALKAAVDAGPDD